MAADGSIGGAVARAFAREGAKVYLAGRTREKLDEVAEEIRSLFLTSRAAARHIVRQGSGVILVFGGSGDPMRDYYIGGTQVAFEAMESMRRQLAAELGPRGVRVVTLRTGGVPESFPEGFDGREAIVEGIEQQTSSGGRRRSRMWATWQPSLPRTGPAR
jgi:NAD(P)-dependent dehydrogenase (short-subunit alcohol dehydrogenase family)